VSGLLCIQFFFYQVVILSSLPCLNARLIILPLHYIASNTLHYIGDFGILFRNIRDGIFLFRNS